MLKVGKLIIPLFFVISIIGISSCSNYQKVLKSTDINTKLDAALMYYEKRDYYKALPLLEELVTLLKGTKKGEKIYYYYAYSHYGLGEYDLASFHFDNYVRTFPNGENVEECQFMNSYCYYVNSPGPSLDQTNTYKAINEFQLFINRYPKSSKVEECNKIIDILRTKLETKNFDNAKLYYKMEDYRAAIVSFKNLLKDFPDTQYREESLFLIIKSNYLYANNSVDAKKEERYKAAVEAYYTFLDTYSKSEFLKEAETIFENSFKLIQNKKST